MHRTRPALFLLLAASPLFAQANAPGASPDSPTGLSILQQMSRHYDDAGSWYIVATEERTTRNEYSREWTKTVMVAAASGNRYHYEGHSQEGSALYISDGKTTWDIHPEGHAYTQEPASAGGFHPPKMTPVNEMAAHEAVGLRTRFADFSKHYSSADRLPDTVLFQDGIAIPIYVVQVKDAQRKGPKPEGYSRDETLWIDKASWAVRKTVIHGNSSLLIGLARIPLGEDIVTTYDTAQLDTAVPEALFQFTETPDAKLVAKFSEDYTLGADLTGERAPEVQLVAADGGKAPLSSYRGKPVLLDFWATWCRPCVAAMPGLARLQQQAAPRGLVILSVDEDEEAKTAAAFLAQHRYTWPNTQDDGKIGDAFHKIGIPLVVLIDAQGKIVYYQLGEDDDALRQALTRLGPQFAGLDSLPPCQTASR